MAIVPLHPNIIRYPTPAYPLYYPIPYHPLFYRPYPLYPVFYSYAFPYPTLPSYLDPYGISDPFYGSRLLSASNNPGNFWIW